VLVNIPVGQWQPFVGVGLGAVTTTSTDSDVPADTDEAVAAAFDAVSDLQTSTAVSYGAGVRYNLDERFSVRADLRQYVVFNVKGIAQEQLQNELSQQLGVDLPTEDNTVQYNEITVGISVAF
jgi:opacity protein-like surface antigen